VEREAHGRSLIGDQVELPVRGMEGQAYGDTRLRPGTPPDAAPQGGDAQPYRPGGLDSGWKP
jgi:ferredoxin-type protein NapG